jgi:hypothetical protein
MLCMHCQTVISQDARIRLGLLLVIYMILMNGGVVAYYSKRQSTVAMCTAMAETIVLAILVVRVKHMGAILFDLQCRQEQETMINSTCVWVDNTAAITTGKNFWQSNFCQSSLLLGVCSAWNHHDHVDLDEQEQCRHHD